MLKFLFKDKVPHLKDLGIFGISENCGNESTFCFYLQRPFGNYLIYKTSNVYQYYNFFKSHGGIHKQFDEDQKYATLCQELFTQFGCSTVCHLAKDTNQYPQQIFGEEFSDPMMSSIKISDFDNLVIKQKAQTLLFLNPAITESELSHASLFALLKNKKIDYIFSHILGAKKRIYLSTHEFSDTYT